MAKKAKKNRNLNIFSLMAIATFVLLASSFIYVKLTANPLCANSSSCIKNLSGNFEANANIGQFEGQVVYAPYEKKLVNIIDDKTNVLGENTASKRIEVNLTNQHLYAYEGDKVIYDFTVSTGKWGRTPTGTFDIWIKLRYTRMSGGSQELGTYYNLPNVPYTMYFYNKDIPKTRGFGIHGAYWHNNFGHPMSHGCINMKIEDAEKLFHWANPKSDAYATYADNNNPGTKVIIYGTAPNE